MALLDSFFGNKTPLGPRPTWQEFAGEDQILQAGEQAAWQQKMKEWEELKNNKAARDAMYSKMAQKVGPTPSPFETRMGRREAPPNMMTSLFPSKFGPASAGRVDILAPEVESIEDIYRKKPNMFRMVS